MSVAEHANDRAVEHQMSIIKEKQNLEKRLQQELLETIYQSTLEMLKVEPREVTPRTGKPSKTESDKDHRRWQQQCRERLNARVTVLAVRLQG